MLNSRRGTTCELYPVSGHVRNNNCPLQISANQQATQLRDLAAERTGNATKIIRESTQQYTNKAQETINNYRGRSSSPEVKREDFPSAPKDQPTGVTTKEPIAPKPVAEPAF